MRYIFIKLLHKFENSLSDLVHNKYLFLTITLNIRIIIFTWLLLRNKHLLETKLGNIKMKQFVLIYLIITFWHISYADSWEEPKTKVYYSSDSSYYVCIIPGKLIKESLENYRDSMDLDILEFEPCIAKMYKRSLIGDSLVWEKQLLNKISPISAHVSNNGKYLVTIDNWYYSGFGDEIIVIYDSFGTQLLNLSLENISPYSLDNFERTSTSILWNCGIELIGNNILSICFVYGKLEKTIPVQIDLDAMFK